ncbi:hypothetical protein D6T64_00725 [Cryobacterium melibiosiphilum]|uniref:Uncharacterized protein n=1 Tax=Cryobacterium melibiosiphilum TaxID=995039 RepID=A0A3A5MPW6_9MICO|nr:hypothetical protein [Cryobacterium melibiosiphilum]RJT92137.1 hypothetical protein D6T64_00725 [Cryobacterium melibiosiphilum]
MKIKKSSLIATATIIFASLLIPTAAASAAPLTPTMQAETTSDGRVSISLTNSTVTLADGDLVYKDSAGAIMEREATDALVSSGGSVEVVSPTRIILTAPPVASDPYAITPFSGVPFTGSWDECVSGYIAAGGLTGVFFGPVGLMSGLVGGAAAAFVECNGLPRM